MKKLFLKLKNSKYIGKIDFIRIQNFVLFSIDSETVLDFVSQNADVHFTSLPFTLHFVTSCLRFASHYTKSAVRNDNKTHPKLDNANS